MKKKKDLNYIVKLEQAISKKYGEETIQNPKSTWSEEKEKDYLEQIEKIFKKEMKAKEKTEKIDINGIMMPKRLLIKEHSFTCPICKLYSLKKEDDLYMSKFECCFQCYVQHVEDREERWLSGWRPEDK
tara:strand:+ start:365 stop:751 length:387 start_codon:yes stop_codon:yes gene_type:complete